MTNPIFVGRREARDPDLDSLAFDRDGHQEWFPFEPLGAISDDGETFLPAPNSNFSEAELREIARRMKALKRNRPGG